jgi:simple sugar transport system ATP-binding protein
VSTPLLELRHITKTFPGLVANDRIDFDLQPGEVHALLGENGAGKTTLMNIAAGLYRPDDGEIVVRGEPADFHSPRDALDCGIGMVHQHFQLVEPFTVAQNLALACSQRLVLGRGEARADAIRLCRTRGLSVDPDVRVWQLSVGERQKVEILKLLGRRVDILILDEPTAVLTPQESDELFVTLRRLASEGRGVVFISHKLNEVLTVADRITVLHGGREVAKLPRAQATARGLAQLMVGREVSLERIARSGGPGAPVVELVGVCAESDRGHRALHELDLTVHSGEIVGVAGVAGNGQRELAEVIAGVRSPSAGRVLMAGQDLTGADARRMIQAGIGYVPEDRMSTGLVPGLDVLDNLILKRYASPPIARGVLLDRRAARRWGLELIRKFAIRATGLGAQVSVLSGGNQQRLVLARELAGQTRALIAMHPTRGLDVGATEQVHKLLLEERRAGMAILLISEDLDEILALADRVAVIFGGRILATLPAEQADRETVGLLMGGSHLQEMSAA